MKKSTLYKIYEILDNNTINLTNSLNRLLLVSGNAENILCELCKNYKELINGEMIYLFSNLSNSIGNIDNEYLRKDIMDKLHELLSSDVITSSEDFIEILQAILFTLNYEYQQIFYCESEGDIDNYKTQVTCELIDIFNNIKNFDIDEVYNHDFSTILDSFSNILENIDDTECNEIIGYDESLVNASFIERIKQFSKLISDRSIYNLNDTKYKYILKTAIYTLNSKKLIQLKMNAIFNSNLSDDEFIKLIEEKTEYVSEATIEYLEKKIGIVREYDADEDCLIVKRKIEDEKQELDIIKKVLKP